MSLDMKTIILLLMLALSAGAQITNVSLGAGPNSGTGDKLFDAFTKLNENDNWLAASVSSNSPAGVAANLVIVSNYVNAVSNNLVTASNLAANAAPQTGLTITSNFLNAVSNNLVIVSNSDLTRATQANLTIVSNYVNSVSNNLVIASNLAAGALQSGAAAGGALAGTYPNPTLASATLNTLAGGVATPILGTTATTALAGNTAIPTGTVTSVSGPAYLTWNNSTTTPTAVGNGTTATFYAVTATNSVTAASLSVTGTAAVSALTVTNVATLGGLAFANASGTPSVTTNGAGNSSGIGSGGTATMVAGSDDTVQLMNVIVAGTPLANAFIFHVAFANAHTKTNRAVIVTVNYPSSATLNTQARWMLTNSTTSGFDLWDGNNATTIGTYNVSLIGIQ